MDLGCGAGRWCRVASNYAGRVVGIDYNPDSIQLARRLSTEKNIEYLVGNLDRLLDQQFEETFDVAILSHVLEHVDDVDLLLQLIHRIARTLIVDVPDFESDSLNLVRREIGAAYYSDADHVREYTLTILLEQLDRNGWQVQEYQQRGGSVMAIATSRSIESGCQQDLRG